MALQLELMRIVGGAAGPVVDFASSLFTFGDEGVKPSDNMDQAKAADLGRAITAIPEGIIQAGGPEFVKRLLANTSREIDLAGTGKPALVPLSSDGFMWLDKIYPGGNWLEMYRALGWILAVNFSPFGRSGSESWSKLSARLKAATQQLLSPSTETQPPKPAGSSGSG
jgi:hypothetical protein